MSLVKKNWPVWFHVLVCGVICSSTVVSAYSQRDAADPNLQDVVEVDVALAEPVQLPIDDVDGANEPLIQAPAAPLPADPDPQLVIPVQVEGVTPARARTSKVHLSEDGFLVGRIGVLAQADANLIAISDIRVSAHQNGKLVGSAKPSPQGIFQLKIDPGVYTLIASGNDGFSSYALDVLEAMPEEDQAPDDDGSPIQIETAAIPPSDFGLLKSLVSTRLTRGTRIQDDGTIPASFRNADGFKATTTVQLHKVMLNADGEVVGVVRRLDNAGSRIITPDVDIFFAEAGRLMTQSVTDDAGVFRAKVQPGVYSVIATSEYGFAAFAAQVIPYDESEISALDLGDGTQFVQVLSTLGMTFDLSNPADFQALLDAIADLPGQQALGQFVGQFSPGTPSGAGGGGAGGGAAGGGLDSLLAAFAAAGVAAAIVNADDDNQSP